MCVKLRDNPLERIGVDNALPALVDAATSFLERATNHNEPVLEEDVFREECRLLHALSSELTTPTVAEWIEVLFKRTDVITRVACPLLLRFAADAALEFAEFLLFQVPLSEKDSCQRCGDQRTAARIDPCVSHGSCGRCRARPLINSAGTAAEIGFNSEIAVQKQ